MMIRSRLLLSLALALIVSGGDRASSGPPEALVTVDVAVERPTPVTGLSQVVPWTLARGLTAGDFEVFSDGTACPIESFESAGAPLSLFVLVDVSASTEVPVDWLLAPLQNALVPAMKPGDRAAFGRFGGVTLHVDRIFSDVPRELREAARAVLELPPEGLATPSPPDARPATAFGPLRPDSAVLVRGMNGAFGLGASPAWDAADAAAGALETQPGRRAIILVTDGRSTGNSLSLEDAIRHAVAADVAVMVVGVAEADQLRQGGPATAQVPPTASLKSMTAMTGGAYAAVFGPEKSRPRRIDDLAARPAYLREGGEPLKPARIDERAFKEWVGRTMAAFVDDRHAAYALSFRAPASDGRFHTLDVRVQTPGLRVRARQRYVAGPKPAA
jgi:hypothetical protein